jgi:hypothetical protein
MMIMKFLTHKGETAMTETETRTNNPENAGRNQDGTFSQGQSGNPTGKPKGARHKATQAVMTLLDGETEALTRKAIELALEGDTIALKLCLDRIAPPSKPAAQHIEMDVPASHTLTDIARSFVMAAAQGQIPPDIAAQLVAAVSSVARVEELEQVRERLEALERAVREKTP